MTRKRPSFSKVKKLTKAERKAATVNAKAKRSSRSIDSPQDDDETTTKPFKHTKKPRRESQHNLLHDDPPVKDDNGALAIAADILLSLPSNIWWRLLQDPDGEIDVSTGSRQEWAHIIPVYLKAGLYLAPNIVCTDYKLQFIKERWDELQLFLAKRNGVLLEWSPIRNKGEDVSHHSLLARQQNANQNVRVQSGRQ